MRALVLGATGFIGGHIVRECLAKGIEVRAMRRPTSPTALIDGLPIETVIGDVGDRGSLIAATKGCDVVFHTAGFYPPSTRNGTRSVRSAISTMRNVLETAAQADVQKVIYTSSTSIVLPPPGSNRPATEDDLYLPTPGDHPQLQVKWAQEQEAFYSMSRGLPIVILNAAACFGPGDVKPLMGTIVLAAAKGWMKFYIDAITNVVDVRLVAAAHIAAIERGRPGERYILGGENLSARELVTIMAEEAGVPAPTRCIPRPLALAMSRPVELGLRALLSQLGGKRRVATVPTYLLDLMRHPQYLDSSKAKRELGFGNSDARVAIRDALAWFRQHGYL